MKRALVSVVVGAAMLSGSVAYAASAPLAPAGAAGVKKAEMIDDHTILVVGGGALVAAGLILVLSNNGNGHAAPNTCSPVQTTCGGGSGGTGTTGTH